MRNFIIKISTFLSCVIAFFFITLIFIPENKANYLYEYHNKLERLDTLSEPRLILVGGSNLAFSLNSKMVSDSLNINVVNMGLHAGIGLRYMLDSIYKYIRKGDILIIMPEYSHFFSTYNGESDALTSAFLYSLDKDSKYLNFAQMMTIISGIPNHIWVNLRARESDEYNYSAYNFNEFGDELAHRFQKSEDIKFYNSILNDINKYAIQDFSDKIKKLKQNGCYVLLFWPITVYTNYKSQKEAIDKITEELAMNNLLFALPPCYFVQPDSVAFDTPYHLNGQAVDESAFRMIKALRIIYNDKFTPF